VGFRNLNGASPAGLQPDGRRKKRGAVSGGAFELVGGLRNNRYELASVKQHCGGDALAARRIVDLDEACIFEK